MQVAKKENLCIPIREYTDETGKQKKVWKNIGELTTFQDDTGKQFQSAELYHIPGVKISVFEQKS